MALIPEDYLKELLTRVDVVDVVGRSVQLKKHGANYFGRCPFHSEKSPSFSVSQTKQFYHCFGCGAHGTAIGFLMEHEGGDFRDVVTQLASEVGMPPPDLQQDDPQHKLAMEISKTLGKATDYYRNQLFNSEDARAYARSRGITQGTAQRFQIGYAPSGWQPLSKAFEDYQSNELLVSSGLAIEGDGGRKYDRFRSRLMFPIRSSGGRVIAMGGRVIGDDREGEPKYLNSPEIVGFEKGKELYGFYEAKSAIKDLGSVFVVEGYMDVVLLAQGGVDNAVATLGTACTENHIRKLLRVCDSIYFCFDGDAAGRSAAWRALENSLSQVGDAHLISFVFLPEGMDPDDYIKQHGKDGFLAMAQEALPLSKFLLQQLESKVDMRSAEGRAKLFSAAKPYLLKMEQAPALRMGLVQIMADRVGVTRQEAERALGIRLTDASKPSAQRNKNSAPEAASFAMRLMELLVSRPHQAGRIKDEWLLDSDEAERALSHLVMISNSLDGSEPAAWVSDLLSRSEFSNQYIHAQMKSDELPLDDDLWESVYSDALKQMEIRYVDGRLRELMILDRSGELDRDGRMEFLNLTKRSHELRREISQSSQALAN